MTGPVEMPSGRVDDSDAQAALGRLGIAMLSAGYAVTDVAGTLRTAAATQGWSGLTIGVLPGAVLVGGDDDGSTRVTNVSAASLTFTQSTQLAVLAREAVTTPLGAATLDARLTAIAELPARYPAAVAALGSGLMSGGIAVVFHTTWWAVGLDAVLGLAIGWLLIVRGGRVGRLSVIPFLTAFAVSALVYALSPYAQWGPTTLYVVCAPLVVLIPGATITTAVIETASGDVVSGGGRFLSGVLIWATLAVGIAAGATVVGQPVNVAGAVTATVPVWAGPPALIVMALGVGLFFDAEWPLMVLIAGVLLGTYGLVAAAGLVVGASVAAGIAAAIVLPACALLERVRPGWPAAVTFRPAFWLLVPGSLGLVTISQLSGGAGPVEPAAQVGYTVIAIALGSQIGGALTGLRPRDRRQDPNAPAG